MTAAVNNNQGNTIRTYAKMTLDFTFKRVFANESNKGALIAFLNRMIDGAKITDVQLLPTERLGMSSSDRKAVFDIFCRENDGTEYIVEMQCAKQKYFRDRALYYAGYPLVEQGRHALEEFVNKSVGQGGADKADRMNGFRWHHSKEEQNNVKS